MQRLKLVVLKNALANVVRGGASSIVAIVLPHFLTRALSVDRYSAWVLMLQIAAYANYLDFGLQTAVARYLAQAIERQDDEQRDRVISTSFALLTGAGILALVIASIIVWQIPHLFKQAPLSVLGELRAGTLVLSVGAALSLPLSTFTGVLIGLHRNEYPALAIGGTRLLGGVAVLVLVPFTHSLLYLSLCIAVFNAVGGLLQYRMARHLLPTMRVRRQKITRGMSRELVHYCVGLTVFSVGMLLVGGVDLVIVGYFSFGATGYYGVAAALVGVVTGLSGAMFSALMAPFAVLQERNDLVRIEHLILSSTRLGSYVSLALIALVAMAGRQLMTLWVGADYSRHGFPILLVLFCAQGIRLAGSGYSIALVATAQQKHGIAGALAEGFTNLIASILGAWLLGPMGVAWGTFVGSICGILWVVFYTMKHATGLQMHLTLFTREAALRPLACFAPVLLFPVANWALRLPWVYLPLALLTTSILLMSIGQLPSFSRRYS